MGGLVLVGQLLNEGPSKTEIPARLGVSRRLICHWTATDRSTKTSPRYACPACGAPSRRRSTPIRTIIRERLETYPELSAAVNIRGNSYRLKNHADL
jgi:hypothetical protein